MNNDHLMRQLDIIPLESLDEKITIIGAGAIGSWVALALAKMGFHDITVYDDDHISVENMNCQFYPMDSIGALKVVALQDMVKRFTHTEITIMPQKYGEGTLRGIVISAVDSMSARRLIWEKQKKSPFIKYVIDPRMGAEEALIYTMSPGNPKDIESYEKTLYSDAEAVEERCTAKATIYTANMLSGLVAKAVKDIATKAEYPRIAHWSIKEHAFTAWKGQVQ